MTYRDLASDGDRSQRQQIKQYEIDHYAEKYGLSSGEAEDFLAAAGESREKADALAERHMLMGMKAFRTALAQLHWSTLVLAEVLGCDPSLALAWFHGRKAVPQTVSVWLETLADTYTRHAPPKLFGQPTSEG